MLWEWVVFAGRADCVVLRAEKGIRKIPLMGVIPGILILVQPLPDLIGIISYLFHFIHVEQSGWLGLRH